MKTQIPAPRLSNDRCCLEARRKSKNVFASTPRKASPPLNALVGLASSSASGEGRKRANEVFNAFALGLDGWFVQAWSYITTPLWLSG